MIDRTLADFRAWLEDAARRAAERGPAAPLAEEPEPIDLHTLLAQMTALRHEVHLQTRAVRAQQEQSAETLERFGQVLGQLEEAQSGADGSGEAAGDELLRPLLKTLVDLYDALALAAREVQRVREAILPVLEQAVAGAVPEPLADRAPRERPRPIAFPFWARLLGIDRSVRRDLEALHARADVGGEELAAEGRRQLDEQRRRASETTQAIDRVARFIASLVTGYTMSLQRLERALAQHELEPIPAVGQPFDPERMEVMEVVADSDRPSGEVVEEVRRGYLWRGRVFRYAQVRVART